MKVENNINNIYFGQKVPTRPLLNIGSGIFDFEDAKTLCKTIDDKFPGYQGYYKKARKIAEQISNKNPEIKKILSELSAIIDSKEKSRAVIKQSSELGQEIDVKI